MIIPPPHRFLPGLLALGLALGVAAPASHAQTLAKAFVASTGSDSTGTGARNAPLRTFTAAQAAIAAGGEIVVLDTAGFGALTITKALTITVPAGINAFVTVASGDGITVAAGQFDSVTLNGLVIEGSNASPSNGINSTSVGTLRVQNCTIHNFNNGILFGNTNSASLIVANSVVRDSGTGIEVDAATDSTGAGLYTSAILNDTLVSTTNYSSVYVNDNGGANLNVTATRCTFTQGGNAFFLGGTGATVVLNNNVISSQGTGVVPGGGVIYSLGNNTFSNNGSGGNGTVTAYPPL